MLGEEFVIMVGCCQDNGSSSDHEGISRPHKFCLKGWILSKVVVSKIIEDVVLFNVCCYVYEISFLQ